jgi:hypothetical protein
MATESIVLEEELPENYEPTDDGAWQMLGDALAGPARLRRNVQRFTSTPSGWEWTWRTTVTSFGSPGRG